MITAAQAAAAKGVSVRRIQRLAADGRIPGATHHGVAWSIPQNFNVLPAPKRKRTLVKIGVAP